MTSNNSFVRNYIIIGIVVLVAVGIGYLLIVEDENTEVNIDPEVVEKGFFNVKPEQEVIQTMFGEKVETKFLLSSELGFESDVKFSIKTPLIGVKVDFDNTAYFVSQGGKQTATVTFDPMEDSSVGQHNITIVAKSQNTAKTFFMILDVVGFDEVQVDVENYNFEPHGLTIVQGTKVTWYNKDDVIHSVTAPDNMFDMDMQRQDYVSFVFDEVGTFPYFCKPHPYMIGTITVISK
tara:strand:+ start:498 stop:1202 length:705 start_codon:yes stop_codon:yes gene_type:complete